MLLPLIEEDNPFPPLEEDGLPLDPAAPAPPPPPPESDPPFPPEFP